MRSAFVLCLYAILALFIAFLIWGAIQPVHAQSLCGPRREVLDAIKMTAKETEVWFGRVPGKEHAVMLLLSGKSGSWTLIGIKPDVACIIATGQGSTPLFGDPA